MKKKLLLFGLFASLSMFINLSFKAYKPFKNKRIAIVFGMSSYTSVDPLPLCQNDADSIAFVLKKLGFDVECYKDLTKVAMENTISDWAPKLKNYEAGLFYFSGHGAEISGENYLFPVDAKIYSNASQTKPGAINFTEILGIFDENMNEKGSKLNASIIILDACRDNPFTKSWSKSLTERGLSEIPLVSNGMFIGYATSPGKTASAVGATNSPYTKGILKNIFTPQSIDDLFTDVNASTRYITGGQQTPWKNSNLPVKFYFLNQTVTLKSFTDEKDKTIETNASANRIKTLSQVISFGSSLNDVIVSEYGSAFSGSVKYETLPVASECKNKLIKYYWRKLSQSKNSKGILTYLSSYGIASEITDDSYITYLFNDDKLASISIRLYFNQIEFHKKLAESFDIDLTKYPSKFYYNNKNYYAFFSLENSINVTTIDIGDKATESFCTLNWYGGVK